ncbi:MAG: response regulator [Holosporales bacterium]|jgi:response regulator of citrate/malate metabolism|nr:response regulator [Holosporales bacterium]
MARSKDSKNIDEIIEKSIGKQLLDKRRRRGLTLASIASKVGVSHQQVQKYEQAKSAISAAMLYKFAVAYGIGVDQFFEDVRKSLEKKSCAQDNVIDVNNVRTRINVLMVEDNPGDEAIVRKAIAHLSKINLLCVHDGLQAIQVLRYKTLSPEFPKPDLILLDISIPKRNGLSVLKDIKRDRELQEVPVVILTNNLHSETMLEAYRNGASGYICKSFNYDEFRDNLTSCFHYWAKSVILPTT